MAENPRPYIVRSLHGDFILVAKGIRRWTSCDRTDRCKTNKSSRCIGRCFGVSGHAVSCPPSWLVHTFAWPLRKGLHSTALAARKEDKNSNFRPDSDLLRHGVLICLDSVCLRCVDLVLVSSFVESRKSGPTLGLGPGPIRVLEWTLNGPTPFRQPRRVDPVCAVWEPCHCLALLVMRCRVSHYPKQGLRSGARARVR